MKKKFISICLIILIGLIGWIALVGRVRSNTNNKGNHLLTTVIRRSFDITVKTIGELDAAQSYVISSMIKGDKGKIIYLVNDGASVEKDEVLVRIDPTPFEEEIHRIEEEISGLVSSLETAQQLLSWEKNQAEREIRSAEFNVQTAQLEYQKILDGDGPLQLSLYKDELERCKEEYERYRAYISDLETLAKQGIDIANELNLAKKKASELKEKYISSETKYASFQQHVFPSQKALAKAKIEKAEMELEQIKKGSVYQIGKATAEVNKIKDKLQSAQNNLNRAKEELERTVIRAPFSGIAILYEAFRDGQQRKPRIGDRVWQNQPLLYLPDTSSLIVNTQVREVDLHAVSVGKPCLITVDAYPSDVVDGEIRSIGTLATGRLNDQTGVKYFRIVVGLKGENKRFRPGMTARVTILIDKVDDQLTVPIQSVFREANTTYCYKHVGKNHFQKHIITVGRINEDFAEIISGLTLGDQVSLIRPAESDLE